MVDEKEIGTNMSVSFLYNRHMKTVVIAFNYVDYQDPKKAYRQLTAMRVLAQTPEWVFPIALGFKGASTGAEEHGIPTFNILKRNSRDEIGNNRDLPYAKEIFDFTAKISCAKIGYINSDILIGDEFLETICEDTNAYIFSRSDIAETNPDSFAKGDFKVIYGGDQHIGADGFFFKRGWWLTNRDLFHDDLIIGETEWDTCYRKIIEKATISFIEKRVLCHVYHDRCWNLTSPGAKNNLKIFNELKNQ